MDAVERVSVERAGEGTSLALSHVHRYEVAAEICAGMRVLDLCCADGTGTAILSRSAATVTGVDEGDAHEWLDRELAGEFDAVVLLDGLERLPDQGRALEQLARHAEAGLVLAVSLPNGGLQALERLPGARLLYQYQGEGSLIRPLERAPQEAGTSFEEQADPERCTHLIALVNGGAAVRSWTRVELADASAFDRRALDLERENRTLRRTNQRLARDRLGVADSAAATALRRRQGGELPAGLEAVAAGGAKLARGFGTVVLNILPHGLTLILLRIRARLRQGQTR